YRLAHGLKPESRVDGVGLRCLTVDAYRPAWLAVDRDGNDDERLVDRAWIGDRERLVVDAAAMPEPLPEFRGDVGRERERHEDQVLGDLARACLMTKDELRQRVVEIGQPRGRDVE